MASAFYFGAVVGNGYGLLAVPSRSTTNNVIKNACRYILATGICSYSAVSKLN